MPANPSYVPLTSQQEAEILLNAFIAARKAGDDMHQSILIAELALITAITEGNASSL
jgi:hypothetical protein